MTEKEKPQEQPGEQIDKLLAKVAEGSIFRCHDGRTFRDLKDLAEGLAAMSDDTFAYHVNSERNDFSTMGKRCNQRRKAGKRPGNSEKPDTGSRLRYCQIGCSH